MVRHRDALHLEVVLEVAGANAKVLADTDSGQCAPADQPVHSHGRHSHRISDLANREQHGLLVHGPHPLSGRTRFTANNRHQGRAAVTQNRDRRHPFGGRYRERPWYQSRICSPTRMKVMVPAAKKGPKGMCIFRARAPSTIIIPIPTSAPYKKPVNSPPNT